MCLSQSVFFQEKERKSFQRCNKPKTFIHCKQANKTKRKEKKRKEKRHSTCKSRNAGRNKPSVCSFQTVLDTVDKKPTVCR
jgi:hypothetical protein